VISHAKAKLERKNCDWIVANDVSGDVMGGDFNSMIVVTDSAPDHEPDMWPRLSKTEAAQRLALKIAQSLT